MEYIYQDYLYKKARPCKISKIRRIWPQLYFQNLTPRRATSWRLINLHYFAIRLVSNERDSRIRECLICLDVYPRREDYTWLLASDVTAQIWLGNNSVEGLNAVDARGNGTITSDKSESFLPLPRDPSHRCPRVHQNAITRACVLNFNARRSRAVVQPGPCRDQCAPKDRRRAAVPPDSTSPRDPRTNSPDPEVRLHRFP